MIRILKKIFKTAVKAILILLGFLLFLSALVYIPPVQKFITDKISAEVSSATGMKLEVGRFRLRFPLTATIYDASLSRPDGDTIARFGRLSMRIAVIPLLSGEITTGEISLTDGAANYTDPVSGMTIRGGAGMVNVHRVKVRPAKHSADIGRVEIGNVSLSLVTGNISDTTAHPALLWRATLGELALDSVSFDMYLSPQAASISTKLYEGALSDCIVDLATQDIRVGALKLDRAVGSYFTDTVSHTLQNSSDSLHGPPVPPPAAWTVQVGHTELIDNAFAYGSLHGEPKSGFDPSHIRVESVNITVDSFYNRGSDVSGDISLLTLHERSGLKITEGSGRFVMDSSGMALHQFRLRTPTSSLDAELTAGQGITSLEPSTPLSAEFSAMLSSEDIFTFATAEEAVKKMLDGKTLSVGTVVSGNPGNLEITRLTAGMPGNFDLSASGKITYAGNPKNISGNIKLDAHLTDIRFVRGVLPDSLAAHVDFPANMRLDGTVSLASGAYFTNMALTTDTLGKMDISGSFTPGQPKYAVNAVAEEFPIYKFLPAWRLGYISFELEAEGSGVNPVADGSDARASLYVAGFDWNNFYYDGIWLEASLRDHMVEGYVFGRNDALDIDMDINGEIRKNYYAGSLSGTAALIDLHAMNLSPAPLAGSFLVDATFSAITDSLLYNARIHLDTVRIAHGEKLEKTDHTTITAVAGRTNVRAEVRSDDFALDFSSPVPLISLRDSFTALEKEIKAQVAARDIDVVQVRSVLPELELNARTGRYNILGNLLYDRGYGFDSITMKADVRKNSPLRAAMAVEGFRLKNVRTDTLSLALGTDGDSLELHLRMANRPGHADKMALIAIDGFAAHNTAALDISQRDSHGATGFNFGVDFKLGDSSIIVKMFPDNMVFGYKKWSVNHGNYAEYRFDRSISADMRFEGESSHFYLRSAGFDSVRHDGVNLDMAGISLGEVFDLLPSPPPISGMLSSNLDIFVLGSPITARGRAGVKDFAYSGNRIGDLGADLNFGYGADSTLTLEGLLTFNGNPALTAQGTYAASGVNMKASIPSLPLSFVNAFIPKGTATLGGTLQGEAEITGALSKPEINGWFAFTDGTVNASIAGTSFKLSPDRIILKDNILDFNDFSLTAPNNRPLSLDGTLNMVDPSRIYADLGLFATDFELVNSNRNRGSPVYGRALVDVDITARGPMNGISVRGDIHLLRATDITYTVQESSSGIKDRKQGIVTFVSFADADYMALIENASERVQTRNSNMLVNIDIDDGVSATVNLSANGNNRIELTGGGNLVYSVDSRGDSRMAGRYTLSGGTVVYSPPVMSQKNFAVDDGSYVEWTGDPADPLFNITAKNRVRTTVVTNDNTSNNVNFDIIARVQNSFTNMALVFDLSAPDDITIQNQLAALAPEQRSQQALGLLVYNTYSGPGTSAKVDSNNPLNSFIEKELNQWTRNNLKNIDLSFGVNSRENASGTQYTDYSYKVSKSLFDDRVKVTVGGRLSSDADASYSARENFVDDISLEYRLTARDNMFLKVYRKNTRESILESEVVDTGVGFIVRRKINRLGNLFRITRSPEKRKIRRELKEMEKKTDTNADE